MKGNKEIRSEARALVAGKWFFRLLAASAILHFIALVANSAIGAALKAMSITLVGEYLVGKASALRQGMEYALPTTKAFAWMLGGFCLQTFMAYIFGAIFMFGLMRLFLKACNGDEERWLADSMSGFARPLDVAFLMLLINLCIGLAAIAWAVLLGGFSAAALHFSGVGLSSGVAIGAFGLSVLLAMILALPAAYAYRQAWFIKSDDTSLSARECLAASRKMMKGFKWRAFLLDLSYAGRFVLSLVFYGAFCVSGSMAKQSGGALLMFVTSALGLVAFYIFVKALFSMMAARAFFYRELGAGSVKEEAL